MGNSLLKPTLPSQGNPETVVSLHIVWFDRPEPRKNGQWLYRSIGLEPAKSRIFLFLCKVFNIGEVNLSIKIFHIFVRYAWGSEQQKDLDKFHTNDQEITDPDF